MKEYIRNHRGHRVKEISLPTPRSILRSSATAKDELWQAGLCSLWLGFSQNLRMRKGGETWILVLSLDMILIVT